MRKFVELHKPFDGHRDIGIERSKRALLTEWCVAQLVPGLDSLEESRELQLEHECLSAAQFRALVRTTALGFRGYALEDRIDGAPDFAPNGCLQLCIVNLLTKFRATRSITPTNSAAIKHRSPSEDPVTILSTRVRSTLDRRCALICRHRSW